MKNQNSKIANKRSVGVGLVSTHHHNGITLIALIISIIVMLILVAVTISMAINGGLFGYAGNATKDTKTAMEDEKNLVNVESGLSTDDLIGKYTGGESTGEIFSAIYQETAEYKENGVTTAWIPKEFAVGISERINSASSGLVIQDEDGNQFVWIPVEFDGSTKNADGFYPEFLEVFKRSKWSNNSRTTGLNSKITENVSNDPTGKYQEMMLSVQKYKGFYIGRYEAGKSDNNQVVIQRDKIPYTEVIWGDSMTEIGTTGAVYLSRNIYTGVDCGVISTLCYGVQWDAMLDFIKDTNDVSLSSDWGNYKDTNEDKWKITRKKPRYYKNDQWNAITETLEKSTVGNVQLTTGANDFFKAKNIYDIAGNVWEWTMEAYETTDRTQRGGNSNYSGETYPASIRTYYSPSTSSKRIGFRPALYIISE